MNVLGLLSRPTAGTYLLRGQDVSSMDDDTLSECRNAHIGFVFQSFNLTPHLTALENIGLPLVYRGLGPGEIARRSRAMLEKVGMKGRSRHLPSQLSGGQRQRIAIARALGARRRDIRNQFLVESVILSVIGGTLGIAAGAAGTWAICQFTGWDFSISATAAVSGIAVSSLAGIFFGLHPARRAARVDPIVALQAE